MFQAQVVNSIMWRLLMESKKMINCCQTVVVFLKIKTELNYQANTFGKGSYDGVLLMKRIELQQYQIFI